MELSVACCPVPLMEIQPVSASAGLHQRGPERLPVDHVLLPIRFHD